MLESTLPLLPDVLSIFSLILSMERKGLRLKLGTLSPHKEFPFLEFALIQNELNFPAKLERAIFKMEYVVRSELALLFKPSRRKYFAKSSGQESPQVMYMGCFCNPHYILFT